MSYAPISFDYDTHGHATLAGFSVKDLAQTHGTPVYIMDQATIEKNCRDFMDTLSHAYPTFKVLYASKANINIGLLQLIHRQGLQLDVSSGGELYTAIKAGVPPQEIYFHGNNKTPDELTLAISHNVTLMLDNTHELDHILSIIKTAPPASPLRIMLRLNPNIEAHTHDYIKTGQLDSKFGLAKDQLLPLATQIHAHPHLDFVGIHSHIGSQIFDVSPYEDLVHVLMEMVQLLHDHSLPLKELNIGGGMGICYTVKDSPPPIQAFIQQVSTLIQSEFSQRNIPLPTLLVEPGRAIVGNAGITLYRVGAIKEIEGIKTSSPFFNLFFLYGLIKH